MGTDLNRSPASPDRPADDEAELAKRAAAGDRRAFAALYERHLDAIYRYAFYRLRTDAEASDVTSDVFHRALVAMPTYQPRRPFLAFLYGIARHVVTDRLRQVRPAASFDDAIAHASEAPSPDETVGRLDDARRLRAAGLPTHARRRTAVRAAVGGGDAADRRDPRPSQLRPLSLRAGATATGRREAARKMPRAAAGPLGKIARRSVIA